MTLSDRLRRLLDERGCSIREAAQLAGMESQMLWRIVTGRTPNPGILTVERVVRAIGCKMTELYADEE